MPPKPRAAPQHPVGVPDRLWDQVASIAEARDERDLIGKGVSAVARRLFRDYVRKHRALLPDDLRD